MRKILTIICMLAMIFSMTAISHAGTWNYTEPVAQDPYVDNASGIKIYKDDGIDAVNIKSDGSWEVVTRQGCQLKRMNSFTIAKMQITYVEQYNYYKYKPCDSSQYIAKGVTELYVESRLIPDHKCEYKSVVTPPSCLYEGYTTYSCPTCNVEWVDDYTDPLGHTYENGVCIRCGKIDTTYSEYILGKVYDPNMGDITPIGWICIVALFALVVAVVTILIGRRRRQ